MADTNTEQPPLATVQTTVTPSSDTVEDYRRALRRRWELASVLNFLRVFEPVIGKEVKMSADEIETALIVPNDSLSKLHITLLKGIRPLNNKKLSNPDVWVTILCKELAEWWPWVADGEVPLTAGKGEEISKYKELDPTIRLLMLKALCELRTEQDDLMAYINDALKEGTDLSQFRKIKISESKTGVSYWYDGDSVMGYRLYKEVNKSQPLPKSRGNGCLDLPINNLEWETLATNLNEFCKISEEMSSSSDVVEGAVCQTIDTEVIPVLEKLEKKRERDLKRKQREAALMNNSRSYAAGSTRTCRIRKPVKYTFDEFDRSIEEAIKVTRDMKGRKVARNGAKHCEEGKRGTDASDEGLQNTIHTKKGSPGFMDKDVQMDVLQVEDSGDDDGTISVGFSDKNDDTNDSEGDTTNSDREHTSDRNQANAHLKSQEHNSDLSTEWTKDLSDSSSDHYQDVRNLRAKNRLRARQRPTRNSAVDSHFAADSDDGKSSENASVDTDSEEEPLLVPDSEDDMSS